MRVGMITCWPGVKLPGHKDGQELLGEREEDDLDVRDKTRVQGRDRGGKLAMGGGHATHTGTRPDQATYE